MYLLLHDWLGLHHLEGETFREQVWLHDSHELLLRQSLPLSLRDVLPHLVFVALLYHRVHLFHRFSLLSLIYSCRLSLGLLGLGDLGGLLPFRLGLSLF